MQDPDYTQYNKLYSNIEERSNIYAFDSSIGLNVNLNGNSSDSSDSQDERHYDSRRTYGLVGLQNIGNTCYMNAALQALSNTLPLTSFFLDCSATVMILSEGRKPGLSRTYQSLIKDIWIKKGYGYVTPSGILYGIRNVHAMFRGYHQHDTQEFLRNFMDQLHEELKQICPTELMIDLSNYSLTVDELAMNSSIESSEGEYETCDSGVSERSSLSDEMERTESVNKSRLSRSTSPCYKIRPHFQTTAVDTQPTTSASTTSTKPQYKYRSIISDIFDGKLLSSVQCLTCSRVSSRVETFQDLSLPIPSRDHLLVLHGHNVDSGLATCSEVVLPEQDGWIAWIISWLRSWFYGPIVSLHDCLAAFFSTDELKGDNMYSCERCNKLRNGIKFSKVLQLPEILCIHLKRFRHELMFSSKISSFVSFPLKGLDVRPYLHADCVSNVTTYDLFSVICHHGTAGGGHYTCYSLNNNQWYEFDDQCVTKVSAETVQACEAYVLFYRKNTASMQVIKSKACEIAEMYSNSSDGVSYVSKQWFSRFKTCAEPGPLDNSDFLCQHNLINPERSDLLPQLAVQLPKQVYDYLYKKFGGCPAIVDIHVCPTCEALQRRITVEVETFLNLSRDLHIFPATHLISSAWFSQWQNFIQKRTLDPPGPIDNFQKLPGIANDYLEISEDIWLFFYEIYGGGPEMSTTMQNLSDFEHNTTLTNNKTSLADEDTPTPCTRHSNHSGRSKPYNVQNNGICDTTGSTESELPSETPTESSYNNVGESYRNCNKLDDNISSTSNTDEESAQGDVKYSEQNKPMSITGREKLYYKTKRRRFRYKLGYKNKNLNISRPLKK
uniref:Ubiquitin carboxyl-terminal hydrolase n=1 Tax=Photinus pyralis TaxID=7054 RepID=A0A1Y1NCH8_PHOPY